MFNLTNTKTRQMGASLLELLIILVITIVMVGSISGLIWHYGSSLTSSKALVVSEKIISQAAIDNYYHSVYPWYLNIYPDTKKSPRHKNPQAYYTACDLQNNKLGDGNAAIWLGQAGTSTQPTQTNELFPHKFFRLDDIALGTDIKNYITQKPDTNGALYAYTIIYKCNTPPTPSKASVVITLPQGSKINSNLIHADTIVFDKKTGRYTIIWKNISLIRNQYGSWANQQINNIHAQTDDNNGGGD